MSGNDTEASDEDTPMSAGESLALIEREQQQVHRQLGGKGALLRTLGCGIPVRVRVGVPDLSLRS